MTMTFEPLIPASLLAFIALAGAVIIVIYALRPAAALSRFRWLSIVALMSAGFALVMLTLLNPTLVHALPGPPGKPLLTVLVDDSASMATRDSAGGEPRYQAASESARQMLGALHDDFDVRIRTFADVSTASDEAALTKQTPAGKSTDLATAIASSLDQDRPQGQAVVLLSDGIHNAGTTGRVLESAHLAKAMAAPVYTRTFGGEVNTFDLAVELRSPQELAFVGQQVPVSVRLKQIGSRTGKTAVTLRRGNLEIARREVEISPLSDTEMLFMVSQDKIGVYPYEVSAEPMSGEVTAANNSASYLLRVVDEPIRVLLLEGKPYWDSKFLVRTLAYDRAVALDSIVKISDDRCLRRTLSRDDKNGAPTTQRTEAWKITPEPRNILESSDSLRGYQVVVLGRDAETFLSDAAIAALQNWIAQDGGSLVCYRGAPISQVTQKLGKMMPVQWSQQPETRFRVQLTDPGRNLKWWPTNQGAEVMPALPALASSRHIESTKPLAVVLATSTGASGAQSEPAFVYQQYGTGRVVVIEGSGMWRWAFLPPQYKQQEDVYRELWQSMLRWLTSGNDRLTPGQRMTLRSDKVSFLSTEPATATMLVREDAKSRAELPKVELMSSAGSEVKSFAPSPMGEEIGTYRVSFGQLPEGRYTARIAGAKADDASCSAIFDVRDVSEELLDLRARPDLMERFASDSGGAVLRNDAAGELNRLFRQHLDRTRPVQVEHAPAWDRWWILAAIFALWGGSWILRRTSGLV